mgnify:FL=1
MNQAVIAQVINLAVDNPFGASPGQGFKSLYAVQGDAIALGRVSQSA